MIKSMKIRKSIRKYQTKDIPNELIEELLQTAAQGSTVGNMQLYSVIETRDKEKKEELSPAHFNQPMIKEAPVVLTFCADFNRFSKWCEERNAKPGYNNIQSFMNAMMDTMIVAQNFCTLAEDEGLGICYIGTTIYNPQMIIKTLDLPQLVFPIVTVTVGYPDENPHITDRLPLKGILHKEKYNDYSSQELDEIYSYKEALEESKKFIEENNKETLAQVFTDVRYKESDNIYMSENLLKVLKEQNFL